MNKSAFTQKVNMYFQKEKFRSTDPEKICDEIKTKIMQYSNV